MLSAKTFLKAQQVHVIVHFKKMKGFGNSLHKNNPNTFSRTNYLLFQFFYSAMFLHPSAGLDLELTIPYQKNCYATILYGKNLESYFFQKSQLPRVTRGWPQPAKYRKVAARSRHKAMMPRILQIFIVQTRIWQIFTV